MEELLKYFDWVALIMASIATSLGIAVINQTNRGQQIHNGWIALILSTFFAVLLIDWRNFAQEWQSIILQFSITVMVACLVGVTRGQDILDNFLGFLLSKTGIKKKDEQP